MSKKHIVWLTTEQMKGLANLARVGMKMGAGIEYVEKVKADGGQEGFDVLVKEIKELKSGPNGE